MKKLLALSLSALLWGVAEAEIIPTPAGAKITIDTLTTEVVVCSPTTVRVLKYIGESPIPASIDAKAKELKRVEAKGKQKIDTGDFYVALNEKDGNVSFWSHEGALIMAEQHRTGSIKQNGDGSYAVSQDFQVGRSEADTIFCPMSKVAPAMNLKGRCVEFGNEAEGMPVPYIATEKGYGVYWNVPGAGRMDDRPEREVKKPGDVTFKSDSANTIDYYFLFPAPADVNGIK